MSHGQHAPIWVGTVTPPADMMNAARLSLPADRFEKLMTMTGGQSPTPEQLVAAVEAP